MRTVARRLTIRRSTTRPAARPALAVAALGIALLLSACAGDAPGGAPAPDPDPVPAPAPAPGGATPDPVDPTAGTVIAAVHLVRSGPADFFVEPVPVRVEDVGDAVSARITAAIDALLTMVLPDDPELFTSVPEGTTLHKVSIEDGIATLDLSGAIAGSSGSSSQERTLAQQLAHTARVDASITGIRLLIDGAPVTELWGHLDWSRPVTADPFALSPVTVTVPLAGETVPVGSVTFRGQATVFEATVLVTLRAEDGRVVEEGFVTATTGAPERGTWEWTVTLPSAGLYTITAGASDPSAGEGPPPFVTTRTIRAGG